jgi:hypothetical protein
VPRTAERVTERPDAHADVAERLAALLETVFTQIERLDSYAEHWSQNDEGVIRLVDKIATEAALLLLLSRRVETLWPGLVTRNDQLSASLGPRIRNDRLRTMLVSMPQTAATLGAGHVFLSVAGNRDATFETLVQTALDDGFGETVERVPYRQLDQRWTRNLGRSDPLPVDDVLHGSILSSRAHPFYMTQGDGYAATHAVMYATDFGQSPLPEALDRGRVEAIILGGLSWHILSQDFDLLLEFLICAECVGLSDSPHAIYSWHLVRRLWDRIGFVPGPTFDGAHSLSLPGEARKAYVFEHMYHTNFVAGMYCAVRLAMAQGDGCATEKADDDRDELEALLAIILAIDGTSACPRAPWFEALNDTPVADVRLMPVLWESAAIDAVRRGDWRSVDRLCTRPPESASYYICREIALLRDRTERFAAPSTTSR